MRLSGGEIFRRDEITHYFRVVRRGTSCQPPQQVRVHLREVCWPCEGARGSCLDERYESDEEIVEGGWREEVESFGSQGERIIE